MRLTFCKSWWVVAVGLIAACSSQRVIPEALEPLVERAVLFREVVAAPDSYQGKVVVFGGEVLKAKRLKEGTQIELLQLPLDRGERPILDRQQSQGRFLAIQQEFLDPATIVEGTKMTIIGELSKSKVEHLDDVEYRYPVLIVKHLYLWPARSDNDARPRPRFSIGVGGGTGMGVGGGGGFGIGF
ncbi:MAG: Slp family lipoprotein [Nitrospiraceae bacterium]